MKKSLKACQAVFNSLSPKLAKPLLMAFFPYLHRLATETRPDKSLLFLKGHVLALLIQSVSELAHRMYCIEGFLTLLHN